MKCIYISHKIQNKYILCNCNRKIKNIKYNVIVHNNSYIHKKRILKNNIDNYVIRIFQYNIHEYELIKDFLIKFSKYYICNKTSDIYKYDNYNMLKLENKILILCIRNELNKLPVYFLNSLAIFIITTYSNKYI